MGLRPYLGRFALRAVALVDALRLRKSRLRVSEWLARGEIHQPFLAPSYHDYTTRVSTYKMAISLELAMLLYGACLQIQPKRVADLGSGFSSYVFRSYAAEEGAAASVISVDDQPGWLEKTRAYLAQQSVPTDDLCTWNEFTAGKGDSFDLVLHDLGSMTTRMATLPQAAQAVAPGGLMFLDDFHKRPYRGPATRFLRQAGFEVFSLRMWTLDSVGRFAALAVREPSGLSS